jgi:hypothetical protein
MPRSKRHRTLYSRKGYKIARHKGLVGKRMGQFLYLHRNYVDYLPAPQQLTIKRANLHIGNFKYNVIKIQVVTECVIVFINSPDFDTADEPMVGNFRRVTLDNSSGLLLKEGHSKYIWHHKWLWVMDDYKGFDVEASFERSAKWLGIEGIDVTRIGNPEYWSLWSGVIDNATL